MQLWQRGVRLSAPVGAPFSEFSAPARVTLPLQWGETPLVRVGERVGLGQKIADGAGETVPLHASVSGTVAAIAPKVCADGKRWTAVVIDSDGEERPAPGLTGRPLADGLSGEELFALLCEAGIREPDGRPLSALVEEAAGGCRTLICSAIDQEPFTLSEDAALTAAPERVLGGLRLLLRLFRPETAVLAVSAAQKEALRAVTRWIPKGDSLRLAVMPDRYPMGDARRLAELIASVRPGESLASRGTAVVRASSAAAMEAAVYDGMPVVRQTVSVNWLTGQKIFSVPLGTPVAEVLRACGRDETEAVLGGPMMGRRLRCWNVPVTKGMSGFTLLSGEQKAAPAGPCIRCGRCAEVCPAELRPYLAARRRGGAAWSVCLRCGACEYACPAGRPLMEEILRLGREAANVG